MIEYAMETNSKHLDRSGRLPVYRITEVIENDGAPCLIPDVAFHPSGAYFAVTTEGWGSLRIRIHNHDGERGLA